MVHNPSASHSNQFRSQLLPKGADAVDAAGSHALERMDDMFGQIAADLYNLASMLAGEGEESVRLVEQAVATADISTSATPAEARKSSHLALAKAALQAIAQREPESLAAPVAKSGPATCIPDDDLEAAGVSREEFESMIAGPERDRVRAWLAELPAAVRAVFALRAVAGFTAAETAALLAAHGGSAARNWSTESARDTFRQGLCALASQLLHASTTR
jgi:DNA-directed RNA polymerase specialized sigma24 family protein